tara:strand:+ start:122 stop:448 length:327 start_codon:yes stop_codon:yes gene_type:complete
MQFQLFYTVDEEKVFEEAGKLLGLKAPTVQKLIDLFQKIQQALSPDDEPVNSTKVGELVGEFREALVELDVRAGEITQILTAYEKRPLPARDSSLVAPADLPSESSEE